MGIILALICGVALGADEVAPQQRGSKKPAPPVEKHDFADDADRVLSATITTFYRADEGVWRAQTTPADSVASDANTFAPSLAAWQAVIEAAKKKPRKWQGHVDAFFDVLEPYYDRESHAYCATKYFNGNDARFYDENAWAVVACMEAYGVTKDIRYQRRAKEVFDGFVRSGWDELRGGLRRGTRADDPPRRPAIATTAAALGALLLDRPADRFWAKRALDWVRGLETPTGLIQEGIREDGAIIPTVWSYNTGVAMRAATVYARKTGDVDSLEWAKRMGNAAIDHDLSPPFDRVPSQADKRFWWDSTASVSLLVEGLCELSEATRNDKYLREARREAAYVRDNLRDRDGLYWRNMRLWTIDADHLKQFHRLTGASDQKLVANQSERAPGDGPVEKRPLVKSLLANAGVSRMFWLLSK